MRHLFSSWAALWKLRTPRRKMVAGLAVRRLRGELLEERNLLAVDLVSMNLFGGSGLGTSQNSTVSENGRFVVFESSANDLVINDLSPLVQDVFRRDLFTGLTEMVSVSVTTGFGGNSTSSNPIISLDGRFVAFTSIASDLVANDTNFFLQDVFVRDMQTGVTSLVSVNTTGGSGNMSSGSPSISDDGRFIAFESAAFNLVANDTNSSIQDVFLRDRQLNTTTLVSQRVTNDGSGSNASINPVISGNGLFVAYESQANNLVANDTNGVLNDVFVWAAPAGPNTLVSINRDNNGSGLLPSSLPSISIDGRMIAFQSQASNLTFNDTNVVVDVFVRDRVLGTTVLASANNSNVAGNFDSTNALIAAGGGHVVFISGATNLVANDTNGTTSDVFVRTLAANTTALVSRNLFGGSGNMPATNPVISLDGRFVAFASQASDLTADDTSGLLNDVFRRDMLTSQTRLVSFNFSGTGAGSSASSDPSISNDGMGVSFSSQAMNLVLNDTNGTVQDVFFAGYSSQIAVTAPDVGGGPQVRVLDARNGGLKFTIIPYDSAFLGGVRVATGDVNGDGVPDIVTAAGTGGGPHVRVFSGVDGLQLPGAIGSFFPYVAGFTGGVFVATADFNGDGRADVITGAGTGGGPHVRVFSGTNNAELLSFFAYVSTFLGGVRVSSADVNGDGRIDVLAATGPGIQAEVRGFNGANGALISDAFAYPGFVNGIFIAASKPAPGGSPILPPTSRISVSLVPGQPGRLSYATDPLAAADDWDDTLDTLSRVLAEEFPADAVQSVDVVFDDLANQATL